MSARTRCTNECAIECRYYVDQLGNQILSTLPTKEPVLGLVEIDYSLVSNPILSPSSGMSVFLKGEVYALKNPTVRTWHTGQ